MIKKPFKFLRNTLLIIFFKIIIFIFGILPRKIVLLKGKFCGYIYWFFSKRDKDIAISNLNLIYGKREENIIIAKKSFTNIGMNLAEYLSTYRESRFNFIMKKVKLIGDEHLDKLYQQKKGIIAITCHQSNFELIPLYIAYIGYPVAVIGRRLFDPRVDKMLVDMRERLGVVNLPSDISARKIFELLDENYVFGILLDQWSSSVASIESSFLGHPSTTPSAPIKIALKRNMPLLPVSIKRQKDMSFLIEFRKPIYFDKECDIEKATDLVNQALGQMVLDNPVEWIWMHKKWIIDNG